MWTLKMPGLRGHDHLPGRSLGDFTLLHKALKLRSLFGYRRQVSLAVQRNIFFFRFGRRSGRRSISSGHVGGEHAQT